MKSYMNFNLIKWGPHHQFSNWAPPFPATALVETTWK